MSLFDSSLLKMALISRPSLRADLQSLIQRVSRAAFSAVELDRIERELIRSLRLAEAQRLPGRLPGPSENLTLTGEQLQIIRRIIGRFRDRVLRDKCLAIMSTAAARGWMNLHE